MSEGYDPLLRLAQVKELTGLGKTSIYALVRAGNFPQPFKPGGYASRWSEKEVREWVGQQRARRETQHAGMSV